MTVATEVLRSGVVGRSVNADKLESQEFKAWNSNIKEIL